MISIKSNDQNQGVDSAPNVRRVPFGITEQQYHEGVTAEFFQECIESIKGRFQDFRLNHFEFVFEKDTPYHNPDNPQQKYKDFYTAFFSIQLPQ